VRHGAAEWASPELGRGRQISEAARMLRELGPWHVWATLTFRRVQSEDACWRAFRRWLRTLAKDTVGVHVRYALGAELQDRGVLHFHALLRYSDRPQAWQISRDELRALETDWRMQGRGNGFARVGAYREGCDAESYLLLHAEWDANVACPRRPVCRRTVCIEAPSGW
jgi:hypothetical protein